MERKERVIERREEELKRKKIKKLRGGENGERVGEATNQR